VCLTDKGVFVFDCYSPWVGNAVGAINHKFFVLFVGYTMASCLFVLLGRGIVVFLSLRLRKPNEYMQQNVQVEMKKLCQPYLADYFGSLPYIYCLHVI
jgi:hypothetical protein